MFGTRLTQTENEKQRHARTCCFLDSHKRYFLQFDMVIAPISRNNRTAGFHTILTKPKRSDTCDANIWTRIRRPFCNSIQWSAPSLEITAHQASTHFGETKSFRHMWSKHPHVLFSGLASGDFSATRYGDRPYPKKQPHIRLPHISAKPKRFDKNDANTKRSDKCDANTKRSNKCDANKYPNNDNIYREDDGQHLQRWCNVII